MTLTTHMVAGAAAARLFATHPVQAFLIGWLSHYILDAIVHWDYPLSAYTSPKNDPTSASIYFNKSLFFDLFKTGLDALLGLIAVFLIVLPESKTLPLFVFLGAAGGLVPDFLQFVYGVSKLKMLGVLQRFHHFMHAEGSFKNRPIIGISFQIGIIILIAVFLA